MLMVDGWFARFRGPGWGKKNTKQDRVEWHEIKNVNTISSSGGLASGNVYRFASKEFHDFGGTAMYYYGYRWYVPNLQRWLNRDPLGEPGFEQIRNSGDHKPSMEANQYVFVHDAPLALYWPAPKQ